MRNDLKNLDALILYFALTLTARGIWLVIVSNERFLASETYRLMNGLIPQWGWAILSLAGALLLFLAMTIKWHRYIWLVVGGLLAAFIYLLLALATWDASSVSILTFIHVISAIFCLSIAWMGGDDWWKMRKSARRLENLSEKRIQK
ncbi:MULTISPECIES: hypothetical protein [Bacillaceae]|uniref:Uncharacterized protein n=1 Tax=Alkalicoccobacillus plakortidis TaxID=444060 RepID=A0A9D5I0L9_9BACI|nr:MULTISPECIES: hypothetical protein [Bacillaceae]KQL57246.1 hypothetical protein AN965_09870 [Alkalicoccobacillus plakortidis]